MNGSDRKTRVSAIRPAPRGGMSLIELLVVIGIIGLLTALVMPAVQSARESARQVECRNRLRNVGLALIGRAEVFQRFSAASYWGGTDKQRPWPNHNWVVDVLGWLDAGSLADRWDLSRAVNVTPNRELAETHLPVLICPSDITTNGQGDISFAVNGGIGLSTYAFEVHDCIVDPFDSPLDLNGNGLPCTSPAIADGTPSDRQLFAALGLFFDENWKFAGTPGYQGTSRHHSLNDLRDGASHTLLATENVRTGFDPLARGSNWASPAQRRTRVYFSHRVCASNSCGSGSVDYRLANAGDHAINAGRIQPEGQAPWPTSFHAGGVNAAFADGRVRFLNESIDGRVYAALFSPDGTSLRGTQLDQGVLSEF